MFQEEDITLLKNAIDEAETIGILVRENPDIDLMAAGLALYLTFSQASKKTSISCQTLPIVELSSLVGIDKVTQEFLQGNDLTISLPYQQGTIEKISYNIEGDRINLVIKAGDNGVNINPSDIQYLKTGGSTNLIFVIGIQDMSQLRKVVSFDDKTFVVSLSNDAVSQPFGQASFIDSSASSVSEITTQVLQRLGMPLDIDSAQNLLSGIAFATDNFQKQATTPAAFEMAAALLKHGARRDGIRGLPLEQITTQETTSFYDEQIPKTLSNQGRQVRPPHLRSQIRPVKSIPFSPKTKPPGDWLTPKIYKGSTTV